MADAEGKGKRSAVCPNEKKRKEKTCMEALRVVLHEDESKRMKRTKELEDEVRGV